MGALLRFQGQDLYKSREVRDKQIVRVLGKVPAMAAAAYHRATGRRASPSVTELNLRGELPVHVGFHVRN